MSDYDCTPACVPCRKKGLCEGKAPDTHVGQFYPNREEDTPLSCGCLIPWPIIVLLGSGGKVQCDKHGWQKVKQKDYMAAKKRTKKARDNQQQELPDEPPF